MNLELDGKGALIVGAAGSIGGAIALALAGEGVRIASADCDLERLSAFAQSLGDMSAGTIQIDLSDGMSVVRGVEEAEKILGSVDILVCAAAGSRFGSLWEVERDDWNEELSVKYLGTADICRRVAKEMVSRGTGVIINIIGIAADIVFSSNPMGSGANAALQNFTRLLAAEVASSGVRVLGISPGMTLSRRFEAFAKSDIKQIEDSIPLGRIAKASEIADVVVFLASARASYITGTIIVADGGISYANRGPKKK